MGGAKLPRPPSRPLPSPRLSNGAAETSSPPFLAFGGKKGAEIAAFRPLFTPNLAMEGGGNPSTTRIPPGIAPRTLFLEPKEQTVSPSPAATGAKPPGKTLWILYMTLRLMYIRFFGCFFHRRQWNLVSRRCWNRSVPGLHVAQNPLFPHQKSRRFAVAFPPRQNQSHRIQRFPPRPIRLELRRRR